MAKKRKKSTKRDSSKRKKEKARGPQGLLGIKLAEAITRKKSEDSSEEISPKSSVVDSQRPKDQKQDADSTSSTRQEGSARGKREATAESLGTKGKPRFRVYIPEKKTPVKPRKRKSSRPHSQPKDKRKKPIPPSKKPSPKRIEKRPEESWHPVAGEPKVSLKTTRGSKSHKAEKEKPVQKKSISWQVRKGSHTDERDIVIGFDLGTACSKVTLQDQQLQKAFVVPFDGIAYKSNRYLLPAKIFVDPKGKLGFLPQGIEMSELKVKFTENPDQTVFKEKTKGEQATAFDLVAAYFGLTLSEVRRWFLQHKALDYAQSLISWQVNVGIPARDYENENLAGAMKTAALTGWNLTLLPIQEIHLGDVKKARETAEQQINSLQVIDGTESIHPDNVNVLPEIIAEVIGYSRSPMRQNGMYLLVDVGASTLDVSTFILTEKNKEDTYPILFADLGRLGGYELHKYRVGKIARIVENKLCSLSESCDGISPLPEQGEYFPELTQEDRSVFSDSDREFCKDCSFLLRRIVGVTKRRRNPLSAAWKSSLPVFLCGGGSQIELYKDAINDAFSALKPIGIQGFSYVPLPKPENLETEDIPPGDYHRVAVSYGLSFSELDIGNIIPQKELDDIEELITVRDLQSVFVDKDKV